MERRRAPNAEVPSTLDTSLLGALAAFDFSAAEARTLLALLPRREPIPLAAVARAAGLPRSTAFSALKTLAARGLIFCEGRYPARYRAAPVSRLATLAALRLDQARRAVSAARLLRRATDG